MRVEAIARSRQRLAIVSSRFGGGFMVVAASPLLARTTFSRALLRWGKGTPGAQRVCQHAGLFCVCQSGRPSLCVARMSRAAAY